MDRRAVADALAQANARTGLVPAKVAHTGEPAVSAARESGWYEVRVGDDPPEIAHWDAAGECWNGRGWHITRAADYPLAVVSPRLARSDEGEP